LVRRIPCLASDWNTVEAAAEAKSVFSSQMVMKRS
jgi:hypothetical protein